MKLGQRLTTLNSMVNSSYSHIWDTCCDHGYLGLTLHQRELACAVHLVDQVKSITERLTQKLASHLNADGTPEPKSSQLFVHQLNAKHLPLNQYSGDHLVIIAGVGGDLTGDIVAQIMHNHPTCPLDFLLCPVRYTQALRQTLKGLDLRLKNEVLVAENGRIYEAILVTNDVSVRASVHSVGTQLWQTHTLEAQQLAERYLALNLAHYQRKVQANNKDDLQLLCAYEQVAISLKRDSAHS